jgi:hypothetical protein
MMRHLRARPWCRKPSIDLVSIAIRHVEVFLWSWEIEIVCRQPLAIPTAGGGSVYAVRLHFGKLLSTVAQKRQVSLRDIQRATDITEG